MSREELRDRPDGLVSERVARGALQAVRTTGSSGSPLEVRLDARDRIRSWTLFIYGFLKCGGRLRDRYAQVMVPTDGREPTWLERAGILRQHCVDLRGGEARVLSELEALAADVLYSYPSTLSLVAAHLRAQSRPGPRPRLVITHGEVLTAGTRGALELAFGCPVRETYGCAEAYRIAFECAHGRLHVPPAAAILESEPDTLGPDGASNLLLTPLYLRAMPLIRYRLGDRGLIADDACPCGCAFPSLLRIAGRQDDFLTLPGGRRVSARAVNMLETVAGVLEYRIVQRTPDRFRVEVRPGPGFGETSVAKIRELLEEGCLPDSVRVDVHEVAELPRASNGKMRAVVSEVQ